VFLVHPENEAFLRGESAPLPGRTPWYAPLAHLALAALALGLAHVLSREEPQISERYLEAPWRPAAWPVLGLLVAAGLYLVVRSIPAFAKWRRCSRLERCGEVLAARAVSSFALPRATTDHETGSSVRCWEVTLVYEFTTPLGLGVTNEVHFARGGPEGEAAPLPGTDLAVLYADEETYELL
jgi:hypothetical protein